MLWRSRAVAVLAVVTLAGPAVPTPAAAQAGDTPAVNAVIVWNSHAQTAIYEVARQAPNVTGRSFAMVQGAVYDAVNAIAGQPYQPYLIAPPSRPGDSADAAVAAAAYRVLLDMFPAQSATLTAQYEQALAAIRDGRGKRGGIAVGEQAATAMLEARRDDGAFGPGTWNVSTAPGQWRPTPPGYAQDGAWLADLKPFVVDDAAGYRTAGPPALSSAAWVREFTEIKALGSETSTVRTADQTEAARWWHDRRLGEWQIKRDLAQSRRLSPLQTARMFAMADIANADALTACFAEKKHWNFWRPVTAVTLADTDGNPATTADPSWTPLVVTPPFPDHTSGHTCSTSAVMLALRTFFGRDDLSFSAYSQDSGTTRTFTSFSQALAEVVEARIWAGVHFRSADVQGVEVGTRVTRDVLAREFHRQR
ncbi:vanadium-dependent haloperoxidase [Actinoplanes sp. NPDC049599]|uniref:vanadium-dependent haloperoxidase n=1 Tax=Actinoplanes sp. NPDC049599 TaxID=3363903 RepID=UPI0037A72463